LIAIVSFSELGGAGGVNMLIGIVDDDDNDVFWMLSLEDFLLVEARRRGGGVIMRRLVGDIKSMIDGDCNNIVIDGVDKVDDDSSSEEKEEEDAR
jgi:hypothetical protein